VVIAHHFNWMLGWGLVLAGFLSGAAIGLSFHREDFLGGYTSFPRRMLRLGHVALIALGCVIAVTAAGGRVAEIFQGIVTQIPA